MVIKFQVFHYMKLYINLYIIDLVYICILVIIVNELILFQWFQVENSVIYFTLESYLVISDE
jgi:hypothetical protein